MRLSGELGNMGKYFTELQLLAKDSPTLSGLANSCPSLFTSFDALYEVVRCARNDAMHSGAYARHVTARAIELCIGLEEALMSHKSQTDKTVADYMVKSPVTIELWQPVARARHLMLMYSFSYLPVDIDGWKLVSEASLAKYLHKRSQYKTLLATTIEQACSSGLILLPSTPIKDTDNVDELLDKLDPRKDFSLWLVTDKEGHLCGVLSPFELM